MILFLNFAPIEFMGGAEKRLLQMCKELNRFEKAKIVSVHPSISNIYGKLVLGTSFSSRTTLTAADKALYSYITINSLIPFTRSYFKTRKMFKSSRVIYIKFEIPELLLLIYFGGSKALQKSIAGVRSPLKYLYPETILDKVHNVVYGSKFIGTILSRFKKVHVLVPRDETELQKKFNLKNITLIPNWLLKTDEKDLKFKRTNNNTLNILFVGELNKRKGTDILIECIKRSPHNYKFTIAGSGPMSQKIKGLCLKQTNCRYVGHANKSQLDLLYSENDVLFLPSRGEGFANVFLEAMNSGLKIVTTDSAAIILNKQIQLVSTINPLLMLENLKRVYQEKRKSGINRSKIQNFVFDNFSEDRILPELVSKIFSIN